MTTMVVRETTLESQSTVKFGVATPFAGTLEHWGQPLLEKATCILQPKERSRLGIGSEEFCGKIQDLYEGVRKGRKRPEDVALRRAGRRLDAARVVETVCRHFGEAPESVGRRMRGGWLRAVVARMLRRHGGLTQREIALLIGVGTGKAVSVQLSRLAIALGRDRRLAKQVEGVKQELKRQVEVSNASSKG
jgi:hypothetical protein